MRDLSIIPATMNPAVDPDLQREVDFFMKWGYLVVEDAISMETVYTLREALDDSMGHKHGADQFTHQLLEEDDAFAVLLDNPPVMKRVTAILGNCIQLHSATARITQKGAPDQDWHRDGPWPVDPDGTPYGSIPGQINTGYYLDALTMDNGPIVVVPGSHRAPFKPPEGHPRFPDEKFGQDKPGQAVMFNGWLYHRGAANRSGEHCNEKSRWLFGQAAAGVGAGGGRLAGHAALQAVQDPLQPRAAVPQPAAPQGQHGLQELRHLAQGQAGLFFFEPQLALQQEEVQDQAQGHVAMPALPAAAFVGAQAPQLLAFLKAGLDGPARAGQACQWGRPDAAGRMAQELPDRVRPGRAAALPPTASAPGRRGQLGRPRARLEGGRGPGCQPRSGAGRHGRRSFRPQPRVDRHLGHAAQTQGRHPVQEVHRPTVALVADHPARRPRARGHQFGQQFQGQLRLGPEGGLRRRAA